MPATTDAVKLLAGRTPKQRAGGSFRSCSPKQTWDILRPLLREWGISRVGNITGLDAVGIPVWIAVRPNSRSLAVSQGKGVDHDSARVSAAMEALEIAHAERPTSGLQVKSYAELLCEAPVVDVGTLPAVRRSLFAEHRPMLWVKGFDLMGGDDRFVPYELVHSDATVPRMPGSGSFLASTNGLASGNNLAEAVLHGLCEVIERDATAIWDALEDEQQSMTRIDLSTVSDGIVMQLLEQFDRAGLATMVWNASTDIDVPVVRCIIVDVSEGTIVRPIPAAFGAGCHPDRSVAIVRALTEAAQSRLTVISGSRDDFDRSRYRTTQASSAFEVHRTLASQLGVVPYSALPTSTSETIEADVAYLVERLRQVGVPQVLVKDLSCEGMPVSVARVVTPVLEGPSESPAYVPGVRALSQTHGAILR